MGKSNNNNSNNKKKRKKKKATAATTTPTDSNFVSSAGPGCYIARRSSVSSSSGSTSDWVLEWEDVSSDDFDQDEDEIPELALDPEEQTLSVCNMNKYPLIAYISILGDNTCLKDKQGRTMTPGTTTNNQGLTQPCVTLIVLCPPKVFCHLCHFQLQSSHEHVDQDMLSQIQLESDVQQWNVHPHPHDQHDLPLAFPLQTTLPDSTSFLCTQGEGGQLTHFFSGNLHAVDFRCPIGTLLLAVADGIVVEANDNNTLTGIAVSNLFTWNSILLQVTTTTPTDSNNSNEQPLFVEYVHISKSHVQVGDTVERGQVIGLSGSIGFSPEPHLHFAAYRSHQPDAPTVRVRFQTANARDAVFMPRAGYYYNADGEQPTPNNTATKTASNTTTTTTTIN
ncbi:Peptidase family M23 [Seminavis robusta]|uniref:Peptidase family M23 n=1 Tax=Seminavis robusta TaxID=568900 RepID=A0A9N8EI75_9STRA|nr:Peptidase family M23 [Seminavis robusta]|eukprot:Sro1032_g233590.1 Peptidase family M23 (393) ;mRNA; f:26778-27956